MRSPLRCWLRSQCGHSSDLSRLRPRLGRLHSFAIWRPARVAFYVRIRRQAGAVVRQSLHVRRRIRSSLGPRGQNTAIWPVRDAPACRRRCRTCRPVRHMASGTAPRRSIRWLHGGPAPCHLSALLRPHVHQRQGCAVRDRHGDCDAGHRARLRRISARHAFDRCPVRPRCRFSDRLAGHGRLRRRERVHTAFGRSCREIARERTKTRRRGMRPVSYSIHPSRNSCLSRDGAGLAMERGQPAQPLSRGRIFLRIF